jgi:putative ABC transport system permease protein
LVVGIFRTDIGGGQNEERAYIPFSTMQSVFNQLNQVQRMGLGVKNGYDVKEVKNEIKKLLANRHKFDETDEQAIGIRDLQEEYNRFKGLFGAISTFVWVVGMGTLLAGIVGVSNIMLIIVKERTKEIGVRKAIGATPWSIVSLILQESIVITSLSGYFGLLAGVGVLEGVRYSIESSGSDAPYFDQPGVDITVALLAVLVLVIAGALAGLVPAIKAANIKPIEALRAD